MSRLLKSTFLSYAIVTFIFGLPLLLAPGRFLGLFGWAPVDPDRGRSAAQRSLGV